MVGCPVGDLVTVFGGSALGSGIQVLLLVLLEIIISSSMKMKSSSGAAVGGFPKGIFS